MKNTLAYFFGAAIVLFLTATQLYGQEAYLPLDPEKHHMLDRMDILSGRDSKLGHSSYKPYYRPSIQLASDSALDHYKKTSKADSFQVSFFKNDQWELYDSTEEGNSRKPFLKAFYRKKNSLLHVNTKDFTLQVSPVLYLSAGKQTENSNDLLYINTRGAEVRGSIDNKVGFYFFAADNQMLMQDYATQKTFLPGFSDPIVPGEGFAKYFKTNRGVDFISARGYITFGVTKHIKFQFGHDKNFIGNGYRSLFLSDNAAPYTFVKVITEVGKFKYTNLFADMNAGYMNGQRYNNKIFTMHHLSYNILPNLNIGLFESIMQGPKDSASTSTPWQLNYLNPIIFSRYIESYQGSDDNSMMGLDLKWNFLRHFSFYGQILLDEFILKEVTKRTGWWGNKQALQMGLKYVNAFGVKNLDLQGEMNYVRPYMYSHKNNFTSYTHYNQALAHPVGANFIEWIGIARLQPTKKLFLTGKLFYIKTGEDSSSTSSDLNNNKGGNIFKPYTSVAVANTYGNSMGQGIATDIVMASLQVSYMIKHNFYIDLYLQYRSKTSALEVRNLNTTFVSGGIRWNLPSRVQEY
ncbi:MAG: hypothetical protein K0R51_1713 [Cytophagaceae bacterium]|jgi:hypothetical protein|nr:hypothetical protein [Cytophagaceae bacterium]